MSVAAGQDIRLENESGIWTITLVGQSGNALTMSLVANLARALDEVEASDASVLVFRSGLERYFGVGGDVHLFGNASPQDFERYMHDVREVFGRLAVMPIPTVAVIDGLALGGGFELALNCGVRLLGPQAKVGFPEIMLGLLPGATGTQRMTSIVGRARADELMLSGRTLSSDEARNLGLGLSVSNEVLSDLNPWIRENLVDPRSAFNSIRRCTRAAEDEAADGDGVELQELLQLFSHPTTRAKIQNFLSRQRG